MKQTFILDENVYIQSHTCRNIKDTEDDYDSFHLILHILKDCHKIGLTRELIEKYQEKTKVLEKKSKIDSKSIRIWKNITYRSDKQKSSDCRLRNLPPNLQHDRHVIEPTVFLTGILVTTDDKLKDRLREWVDKEGIKIGIMSPREALVVIEL